MKRNLTQVLVICSMVLLLPFSPAAQIQILDTTMFSPALNMNKTVRIVLPPGYHQHPDLYYPVVYYLHGWTGDHTSETGLVSYMNTYMNNGTIQPFIMVKPNSNCAPFQGSMYVNSPLWGNYQDYVTTDLIAWVDSSFRTVPQKNYRGLIGQSMGSYGCLFLPIAHPDLYIASAGHAGGGSYYHYDSLAKSITLGSFTSGPPYFYNYNANLTYVKAWFLLAGAFTPNPNTSQTYINPQIVDYPFDELGNIIDSSWEKMHSLSAEMNIQLLSPTDSVSFILSCGTQDDYFQFDPMRDLVDTMLSLGLDVEWLPHTGDHAMPALFRSRVLKWLDTLLGDPVLIAQVMNPLPDIFPEIHVWPNPSDGRLFIDLELLNPGDISVEIIDMSGRVVSSAAENKRNEGKYHVEPDIQGLSPGLYIIHLQIERKSFYFKWILR